MGILRDSFGPDELPRVSNILLDDISQTIKIKRLVSSGIRGDYSNIHTYDILTYDEYEELIKNGLVGARAGRKLRNESNRGNVCME